MQGKRHLFDLDGRVALITGGSRGLGLQVAEALGDYGASVMITAPVTAPVMVLMPPTISMASSRNVSLK